MELLLNSKATITEVAFEVGFDSQSYFDRIFRRLTGRAPSEFRRKY
jgi:AraC family transcriptional regulator, melibiose operon regulatory protein